jgi:hypothetical protein
MTLWRLGTKVCPVDGEYDFVNVECDNPIEVTAQNLDNIVGSLRLKDPPCKDPQNCRRVGVHDSSLRQPMMQTAAAAKRLRYVSLKQTEGCLLQDPMAGLSLDSPFMDAQPG